jgi:hypothetical protein
MQSVIISVAVGLLAFTGRRRDAKKCGNPQHGPQKTENSQTDPAQSARSPTLVSHAAPVRRAAPNQRSTRSVRNAA